jgi:hypothetical protein
VEKEAIPVKGKSVQVDLLHPTLKYRLMALFRHPEIRGRMVVSSGVRSYAEQKRLYDGYRSGKRGFNLAANPDWKRPDGYFFGSFHQSQPDGYGYAVDFHITDRKRLSTVRASEIARTFGLRPTVRGEWWHHQPRTADGWFVATAFTDPPTPTIDFKGILAFIKSLREEVSRRPLRRRSRGKAVEVAQRQLGAKGFDPGSPDGVFGWHTRSAAKRFQRLTGLTPDGVIGSLTWDALLDPGVGKDESQGALF